MRPPEPDSLPFRVDVINGWPLSSAMLNEKSVNFYTMKIRLNRLEA